MVVQVVVMVEEEGLVVELMQMMEGMVVDGHGWWWR